jgi:hypothetical protein
MDPFLLSLAIALATGISNVAGRLIDRGVIEPALEPTVERIKRRVQGGVTALEKDDALVRAILAAIQDASMQKGEARAVKYMRGMRLHEIVEPGNEALRDEVTRLVLLASSDNPRLVPDSLLDALHLGKSERPALARFLFLLRRRLYMLADFQPLFDAAHQQTVEAALKQLADTVEGDAVRVSVVERAWNPEAYLSYLGKVCNLLPLGFIDPQYAAPTSERTITLNDVYTNLSTSRNEL